MLPIAAPARVLAATPPVADAAAVPILIALFLLREMPERRRRRIVSMSSSESSSNTIGRAFGVLQVGECFKVFTPKKQEHRGNAKCIS